MFPVHRNGNIFAVEPQSRKCFQYTFSKKMQWKHFRDRASSAKMYAFCKAYIFAAKPRHLLSIVAMVDVVLDYKVLFLPCLHHEPNLCAALGNGWSLCTRESVNDNVCSEQSCGHDFDHVWAWNIDNSELYGTPNEDGSKYFTSEEKLYATISLCLKFFMHLY